MKKMIAMLVLVSAAGVVRAGDLEKAAAAVSLERVNMTQAMEAKVAVPRPEIVPLSAAEVLEMHRAKLMAIPGVTGLKVLGHGGEQAIVVTFSSEKAYKDAVKKKLLPAQLYGYPVGHTIEDDIKSADVSAGSAEERSAGTTWRPVVKCDGLTLDISEGSRPRKQLVLRNVNNAFYNLGSNLPNLNPNTGVWRNDELILIGGRVKWNSAFSTYDYASERLITLQVFGDRASVEIFYGRMLNMDDGLLAPDSIKRLAQHDFYGCRQY
ncbi:MAG: hypothetical protein M0011_03820 [Elusimicrobia bacterium]|nr:hypothetical protein [Elusimicrobiota bacterium]